VAPQNGKGYHYFEKTQIKHMVFIIPCTVDFMNKHLKFYARTPFNPSPTKY
jgi:hypothetical protein